MSETSSAIVLVCPHCRTGLAVTTNAAECGRCGRRFPFVEGFLDFSEGESFDQFTSQRELSEAQLRGLRGEEEGAAWRIDGFYLPLIRKATEADMPRLLDCGCGNGLSVDLLARAGIDAWGNDVSELRRWQWRERTAQDRLVFASGVRLPFADASFDVVISSGVIEHIGVTESRDAAGVYKVVPREDRDALRSRFLAELLRVLSSHGTLFIDCPNGRFPIDFWHGSHGGNLRLHSVRERFLPTFRELDQLARAAGADAVAISPHRRFRFGQVGAFWYGRLLRLPVEICSGQWSFAPSARSREVE